MKQFISKLFVLAVVALGMVACTDADMGTPAVYNEHEIVMDFTGKILEGSFPSKQLKLLTAWTALHEDELNANWILLSAGDGYFKIEPLR